MTTVATLSNEPWRRRIYLPAYSVAEAARYAKTYPQTIAYWFYGDPEHAPFLRGKERRKPLSYLQLVEVAFVATFRRLGISLQRIRSAHDYLAQILQAEFPFALAEFKTEGTHILLDLQQLDKDAELGRVIVADSAGQVAWQDLLADRFLEFEYEKGLAVRWYLAGRTSPVLIDPRISFGAPTVQGIATWAIRGRAEAGETADEIAGDFTLSVEEVRQALDFEGVELAA